MLGLNSVAAMMVLGACVYVVLNTGLVSLVIALGTNLGVALLVAPAMYLVHTYYRMHIVGAVLENISNVSQESEAVLAGASRGR